MNNETPVPEEWDASLRRALKKLPDQQAPASLMPNVMEQIRARAAKPWYQGSWWQWPLAVRVVSAVALALLVAGLMVFGGRIWESELSPELNRWSEIAGTICSSLAGGLARVLRIGPGFGVDSLRLGLSLAGLALFVTYLTIISLGSVVYRVFRK